MKNPHYNEEEVQDVDFEPEEEMGTAASLKAKLDKVRAELKEAQQKRDEYLDGWQRAKADAVNIRRESLLQSERASSRGRENLVEDLIPALDSFDMATASEAWNKIDPSWRAGMEMVRGQLLEALTRNGIERFGAAGDKIDHSLHEAVQVEEGATEKHDTIARVLRYGYRIGDRVIRPAQVVVYA